MKTNLSNTSDIVSLFNTTSSGGSGVAMSYNTGITGETNQSPCKVLLSLSAIQRNAAFQDGAKGRAYVNTAVQDYPPERGETGTKGVLVSIEGDYLTFGELEDYLGNCKIRDAKKAHESYFYGGSKHQFKIGANYFLSKTISVKVLK